MRIQYAVCGTEMHSTDPTDRNRTMVQDANLSASMFKCYLHASGVSYAGKFVAFPARDALSRKIRALFALVRILTCTINECRERDESRKASVSRFLISLALL